MFKAIELHNFRGFQETKLSGLSRINLITGLNGAGKTTLLEAGFLLCGGANASLSASLYGFRGDSNFSPKVDRPFRSLFKDLNPQNFPRLVGTSSELMTHHKRYRRELVIKPRYIISKSNASTQPNSTLTGVEFEFKGPSGKRVGEFGWLPDAERHLLNPEQNKGKIILGGEPVDNPDLINGQFVSPYFKDIAPQDHAVLTKMLTEKTVDQLINALKIVDQNIVGLLPLSDESGPIIYADLNGKNLLPISLLGAGLANCMHIIMPCVANKNSMIFIDEFENGLHYSLLEPIFRIIFKLSLQNNNQIFITTHSNELLSYFINVANTEDFKDIALFRLSRRGIKGPIPRYSLEEADSLIDANMDIR